MRYSSGFNLCDSGLVATMRQLLDVVEPRPLPVESHCGFQGKVVNHHEATNMLRSVESSIIPPQVLLKDGASCFG